MGLVNVLIGVAIIGSWLNQNEAHPLQKKFDLKTIPNRQSWMSISERDPNMELPYDQQSVIDSPTVLTDIEAIPVQLVNEHPRPNALGFPNDNSESILSDVELLPIQPVPWRPIRGHAGPYLPNNNLEAILPGIKPTLIQGQVIPSKFMNGYNRPLFFPPVSYQIDNSEPLPLGVELISVQDASVQSPQSSFSSSANNYVDNSEPFLGNIELTSIHHPYRPMHNPLDEPHKGQQPPIRPWPTIPPDVELFTHESSNKPTPPIRPTRPTRPHYPTRTPRPAPTGWPFRPRPVLPARPIHPLRPSRPMPPGRPWHPPAIPFYKSAPEMELASKSNDSKRICFCRPLSHIDLQVPSHLEPVLENNQSRSSVLQDAEIYPDSQFFELYKFTRSGAQNEYMGDCFCHAGRIEGFQEDTYIFVIDSEDEETTDEETNVNDETNIPKPEENVDETEGSEKKTDNNTVTLEPEESYSTTTVKYNEETTLDELMKIPNNFTESHLSTTAGITNALKTKTSINTTTHVPSTILI